MALLKAAVEVEEVVRKEEGHLAVVEVMEVEEVGVVAVGVE